MQSFDEIKVALYKQGLELQLLKEELEAAIDEKKQLEDEIKQKN